ncbi:uncharacterized protein LOC128680591 isoform X1 [Plodia interpunctella]|uniref:uncharacterized protein LOC128680591 isoform X1 n=1 Tax=Plodia interpunctella TaxID=58824 RepID=UPI0023675AC6|nr:uncharacterized protein LOC128680591 isoform X1 [Plodia interpunctella]
MIEKIVWHVISTLFLLLLLINICKEDSYEVCASPVKHIPLSANFEIPGYSDEEVPRNLNFLDILKKLPPTRPVEFRRGKLKKRKKTKKNKKIKGTITTNEITTGSTVMGKNREKKPKRRHSKKNKKNKLRKGKDEKRKPFDITVHIKVDDVEQE